MPNVVAVIPRTLTEQGSGGTTSFSVNMPATVLPGELIGVHIGGGGGLVTAPIGWGNLGGSNQAAADSAYGFYKYATGTEGGTSVVFTLATAGRATGIVTRYQNVRTISPLAGTSTIGQNVGAGSSVTVASMITTASNAFLVSGAAGNAATGPPVWTPPAGFTNMMQSTGTGKGSAYADGVLVANPGATGTAIWTWTSSGLAMDGYLAALAPTTSVGGSTPLYGLPYAVPNNPANMPMDEIGMMGATDRSLAAIVARKTADETRNLNTVTSPDSQLTALVQGNAIYRMRCYVTYSGTASALLQTLWDLPSGASLDWVADGFPASVVAGNTGIINRAANVANTGFQLGTTGTSTVLSASLNGWLTTTNAGRISLAWAPVVLDSSGITLYAGSSLRLRRVA